MNALRRREFLTTVTAATAGAALTLRSSTSATAQTTSRHESGEVDRSAFNPHDWHSVRAQFPLTDDYIHMAMFLLASHPAPVAAAIDRHRRGLDANPADYWHDRFRVIDSQVCAAVAEYTGGNATDIALTDSTTMGLGLVYNAVHLKPGDEILIDGHSHYSTLESCRYRTLRDNVTTSEVKMYADPATATVDEIVTKMRRAITDRTRVLAVTWVQSCTGVKMPIRAMADALQSINASRDPADRVLFCVDGVHGFGNQSDRVADLGCDVFIAGTHKWMFGPRGTGIIWATPEAWKRLTPVIPSFGPNTRHWLGGISKDQVPLASAFTPGGFHSFEHRWALPEAFKFHKQIGPERIHARIAELNTRCKQGLAEIATVTVHTPMNPELSAGIIAFEIDGVEPGEYVQAMHNQHIIGSSSPYRVSYPRLAPSALNNEDDVDMSVQTVARLFG